MSKIFQALHGAKNEVSDLLPELIGDSPVAASDESPVLESADSASSAAHHFVASPSLVPETNGVAAADDSSDWTEYAPPPLLRGAEPVTTSSFTGAIRELPLAIPASLALLPFEDPHAHAAEHYRILRTKLSHHPMRPKMMVVSSANPGDGKTFTAINLAGVLSLKGDGKILLVDGDFRRSAVHKQLGLPQGPGLSEVILGACQLEEAIIQAQQFPNLHIFVNGRLENMNPSELLDSPHWRALCQAIRRRYQYIVVDSPPVSAVTDFELIQMAADGTVLVVRPDHTNRSACFKAIEAVPKEKLLGVILNCAKPWFLNKSEGYGYGYSYSYGYGYGSKDSQK
jgi:capsular exopolysaccharide synthesis family protein